MTGNITGVILAGGASKRFNGITKAQIEIGGRTIISRITETFNSVFDEIVIVTNTTDVFREYDNYIITGDKFLNKGPLGGIHAALTVTRREALFVVAGDMPLLEKELIIRQIEFFNNDKCDILVPVMNNYIEPLHGIYRRSVMEILEEYLGGDNDYSMREFFKRTDVHYFPLEKTGKSERAFTNINTPDDVTYVNGILRGTG
jgi:molybdopterin-guanine dinucleotide biosynthesis protein A